ncbi:MAG: Na+/H+ antiporter NhaA, partial [Gammaproteobacteria bacterium]
MSSAAKPSSGDDKGVYHAPWEMAFDKVLSPFEEFIHRQTTGGMLLMATAIIALLLANGPLAYLYQQAQHLEIGLRIGSWSLQHSLH